MTGFSVTITISRELYKEFALAAQTGHKPWQKNFYLLPAILCAFVGLYSLFLAPKGTLLAETQTSIVFLASAVLLAAKKQIALYRIGKQYDADTQTGAPHQYMVNEESISLAGSNFSATYPRQEITKVISEDKYLAVIANRHTAILFPAGQLTAEQRTFIERTFTPGK